MDLVTITEDAAAAAEAFRDYRRAFLADHRPLDAELMRGYRWLMKGNQLIRLSETISAGGLDDLGYPRLAIAQADERAIQFERNQSGRVVFTPDRRRRYGTGMGGRAFALPDATFPPTNAYVWQLGQDLEAILPLIPPRFRPPHGLSGYHLLWEAAWTPRRQGRAPVDPALLKRIAPDLFAVLAIWDLTPLERAVLELRVGS